jgi:hypothetical protein
VQHVLTSATVNAHENALVKATALIRVADRLMCSNSKGTGLAKTQQSSRKIALPYTLVGSLAIVPFRAPSHQIGRMPHKPRHEWMSDRDAKANFLLEIRAKATELAFHQSNSELSASICHRIILRRVFL